GAQASAPQAARSPPRGERSPSDGQTDERRGDRGVVSRAAGATALVHPSRDTVTLMRRLVVLFALLLSCRSPQGTDAGLAATRPPASSPLDAAPEPAEDLPEAP